VYFDVSSAATLETTAQEGALIATRLRQIGVNRFVFGADLSIRGNPPPAASWGVFREKVPLTTRGPGLRRRVAVPGRDDAEPRWYEISEARDVDGETVGFALEADDLVAAEASLRRFVETLTETFAHLPIGLAVFDKNRRLGLFNPALTDLVKIDAVWLAVSVASCC